MSVDMKLFIAALIGALLVTLFTSRRRNDD